MALGKKDIKNIDGNQIDNEGCKYLNKAYWPNLQTISLCKEILLYLDDNQISG